MFLLRTEGGRGECEDRAERRVGRDRGSVGSSSLLCAYCTRVVRSSIKIPTEISHSPEILIPDRSTVRHANIAEFLRAIFLSAQFQRRTVRITCGNERIGLTADDKANVILSVLREIPRSQPGQFKA